MSTKNLSSVASEVINTYGITATNVINSYRFGGERFIGFVDNRFADAVNRGASVLRKDLRSNLIDTQQRMSSYYVKGVHFGTERAQGFVGVAVDLANKGVGIVAANAERLDRATKLNALETLNRVAMPAASIVVKLAEKIEEGSSKLVTRVAGSAVPAKAVATRKLKTTTRKAAATRKRVTKTATKRVNKAIAEAANDTSNAARRVSRRAKSASAKVESAVGEVAGKTSNAARRVSRKAEAAASAA